jgi:effector-binding domain-containing protein
MDMQDLDVEIGFPVSEEPPGRGEIQGGELYARGPNIYIDPAFQALSVWMMQNGYKAGGAAIEVDLDVPSAAPAEELRTQIVFPLK